MQVYYLLPILLIGLAVAYAVWAKKRALEQAANMSPEEAAQRFHDFYSAYFELEPGERIVGASSGVEFQGAKGEARKLAGAARQFPALLLVSAFALAVLTGCNNCEALAEKICDDLGPRTLVVQVARVDRRGETIL